LCGLLPGTQRAELLDTGEVVERVVRREDLARVDAAWMVNSVRGWVQIEVDSAARPAGVSSSDA
jgi:para-aminobenzoate synthetase/4-amino-4-deoxychorismate lyase